MEYYVDLDNNNKVAGVKQVKQGYINNGKSIKLNNYDSRLLGTTYNNGVFEGNYITLETNKTNITINEIATLTVKTIKWDDTSTNISPVTVETVDSLGNKTTQSVEVMNGLATIEFSSQVAGTFTISTKNDVIRNGQVIIHVE